MQDEGLSAVLLGGRVGMCSLECLDCDRGTMWYRDEDATVVGLHVQYGIGRESDLGAVIVGCFGHPDDLGHLDELPCGTVSVGSADATTPFVGELG